MSMLIDPPARRCWACETSLSDKSVFCQKCQNYQGWRRFFHFSHTAFALLIALISVISLSAPTFVKLAREWSGEVFAVWFDDGDPSGRVRIWAYNDRNHPIVVTGLSFSCSVGMPSKPEKSQLTVSQAPPSRSVEELKRLYPEAFLPPKYASVFTAYYPNVHNSEITPMPVVIPSGGRVLLNFQEYPKPLLAGEVAEGESLDLNLDRARFSRLLEDICKRTRCDLMLTYIAADGRLEEEVAKPLGNLGSRYPSPATDLARIATWREYNRLHPPASAP